MSNNGIGEMSRNQDTMKRFFLQEDRLAQIQRIGTDQWFPAYSVDKSEQEDAVFFSALISNDAIE